MILTHCQDSAAAAKKEKERKKKNTESNLDVINTNAAGNGSLWRSFSVGHKYFMHVNLKQHGVRQERLSVTNIFFFLCTFS